ncbi:MAG: hypothetical protein ABEI32_13590 [Halothece sp.]|jgi:hypothetical protein
MTRRKKKFACGHQGYGQVCHRCEQKESDRVRRKRQRQAWEESFRYDPIDLKHLPKNVVIKTRRIISQLRQDSNYRRFKGKRLRHNRSIISIPINRDYRLICRDEGAKVLPETVISHQDYNVCKPGSAK